VANFSFGIDGDAVLPLVAAAGTRPRLVTQLDAFIPAGRLGLAFMANLLAGLGAFDANFRFGAGDRITSPRRKSGIAPLIRQRKGRRGRSLRLRSRARAGRCLGLTRLAGRPMGEFFVDLPDPMAGVSNAAF